MTRLKRLVMAVERLRNDERWLEPSNAWLPSSMAESTMQVFDNAISSDLNTSEALVILEDTLSLKKLDVNLGRYVIEAMDEVLGLNLLTLTRADLRLRPKSATITEDEIEAILTRRKEARAAKDFAASDALRDELAAQGVEVMDGDPLGWDWKLGE